MKSFKPGYFGEYLARFIHDEKSRGLHMNAKILAKRLGITPAMIARFLSGESKSCYTETLSKMVAGISPDPKIQAGLVKAYLLDQRPPNANHLIAIITLDDSMSNSIESLSDLARSVGLPSNLVHSICEIIKGCSKSPRMSQIVADLGDIAEFDLTHKPGSFRALRSANLHPSDQPPQELHAAEQPPAYNKPAPRSSSKRPGR